MKHLKKVKMYILNLKYLDKLKRLIIDLFFPTSCSKSADLKIVKLKTYF